MTAKTFTPEFIQTKNAKITQAKCLALDIVLYHTEPAPENPHYENKIDEAAWVRAELLGVIRAANPDLASQVADRGLNYIYLVAWRVQTDK